VMFARSATTASILSVIAPVRQSAGVSYSLRSAGSGWTNLYLSVGGTRVLVRISPGNALMRG
jgi:hypothetical protein